MVRYGRVSGYGRVGLSTALFVELRAAHGDDHYDGADEHLQAGAGDSVEPPQQNGGQQHDAADDAHVRPVGREIDGGVVRAGIERLPTAVVDACQNSAGGPLPTAKQLAAAEDRLARLVQQVWTREAALRRLADPRPRQNGAVSPLPGCGSHSAGDCPGTRRAFLREAHRLGSSDRWAGLPVPSGAKTLKQAAHSGAPARRERY
ncbi:hypothetical protein STRIP9103_09331 [Streptomyces ipomoeae 91-03]|uniref:Uncharacterized protein n=1 Tax=Streptomyces ipomoeae 91-03 TaxID=698759 RepID=L1L7B7_9ACTN|nr:hypothetical protein STRIP9103_09331 [Streptomyces ipomoeae 91-03]